MSITCALSLCLDLGLGALKVPKEADEGGRATCGSARKGKRQHASPQNPLLDCSLCGKVFSSASSLSKHYLTHSQERKHVCKICGKAFKRQDHLYVGVWSGGWRGMGELLLGLPYPIPGPPASRPAPRMAGSCARMPLCSYTARCGARGPHSLGQVPPPSRHVPTGMETSALIAGRTLVGFKTYTGSLQGNFVM